MTSTRTFASDWVTNPEGCNLKGGFMSAAALAEEHKSLAHRFREEVWKNLAIDDQICAEDATIHAHDPLTPELDKGPVGLKQLVTLYLTAFPDAARTVEDLVVEGDKVVARWTGRGTHQGKLGQIAPTGRQVTVTGIEIHRIAGGKIQETWINWDTLGMLQQLGVSSQ
jgi:ketosteroid isomerase-like protein